MKEELIKTLAESAGFDIFLDSIYVKNDEGLHRATNEVHQLAQLIVKECASIVEEYGLSLVDRDENHLGETLNLSIRVQEAGNKIKQHFGVEL